MPKSFSLFVCCLLAFSAFADRIYMLNTSGYNMATPELIAEMTGNGHTVVENWSSTNLPAGFTSRCVDPTNGYDWLCLFGDTDFSFMTSQLQAFIDAGGKIYYQYEIGCCMQSSAGVASVAASLTGLPISEHPAAMIAWDFGPAWRAPLGCCGMVKGNAYKSMNGIPSGNQLVATETINAGAPPVTDAPTFGFYFATTDFTGTADKGGFVAVGDMNMWFDGEEPGNAVNAMAVDFFFPGATSTCYLFPPGCLQSGFGGGSSVNLGDDVALCGGSIVLDVTGPNSTYVWQDNSTGPTFTVAQPGTYWVTVTNSCGVSSDTIVVTDGPDFAELPEVQPLCSGSVVLDVTTAGATYLWQDNSTGPTYTVTGPGTYYVTITASCGSFSDTTIVQTESITVDLPEDQMLCDEELLLDVTAAGGSYLWQDNSTNAVFHVVAPGDYSVVVNIGGCLGTDSITVSACLVLEMPNVFSPDGDGVNDLFLPINPPGGELTGLFICNRWGSVVFDGINVTGGWDGKWKGKTCSEGVYFWIATYQDQTKSGFVTLTR